MLLEAKPPLSPAELAALEHALARAGIAFDRTPERPISGWSRVSAVEAVDSDVGSRTGYTRSPRSTPGATRA